MYDPHGMILCLLALVYLVKWDVCEYDTRSSTPCTQQGHTSQQEKWQFSCKTRSMSLCDLHVRLPSPARHRCLLHSICSCIQKCYNHNSVCTWKWTLILINYLLMLDADISGGGTGTSWRNPNYLYTRSGEYTSTLFMYTNKYLVI
jgi:hypothetical protein